MGSSSPGNESVRIRREQDYTYRPEETISFACRNLLERFAASFDLPGSLVLLGFENCVR